MHLVKKIKGMKNKLFRMSKVKILLSIAIVFIMTTPPCIKLKLSTKSEHQTNAVQNKYGSSIGEMNALKQQTATKNNIKNKNRF